MIHITICFNPRTRKGYDTNSYQVLMTNSSFNPRTRKGYDIYFSFNEYS